MLRTIFIALILTSNFIYGQIPSTPDTQYEAFDAMTAHGTPDEIYKTVLNLGYFAFFGTPSQKSDSLTLLKTMVDMLTVPEYQLVYKDQFSQQSALSNAIGNAISAIIENSPAGSADEQTYSILLKNLATTYPKTFMTYLPIIPSSQDNLTGNVAGVNATQSPISVGSAVPKTAPVDKKIGDTTIKNVTPSNQIKQTTQSATLVESATPIPPLADKQIGDTTTLSPVDRAGRAGAHPF